MLRLWRRRLRSCVGGGLGLFVTFAAREAWAIQGGTPDTTNSYVVALVNERTGAYCSATAVAPNLVVTTRHCIDLPANPGVDCHNAVFAEPTPPTVVVVSPCADARDTQSPTCEWFRSERFFRPAGVSVCGSDITVVLLSRSIPASSVRLAVPVVRRTEATPPFDTSVVVAAGGYGGDDGTKGGWGLRRFLNNIPTLCVGTQNPMACSTFVSNAGVASDEFVTAGRTCEGDSGGPAVLQSTFGDSSPQFVGIVSRAQQGNALCGSAIYERTDLNAALLLDAAAIAASEGQYPLPAWATRVLGDPCAQDSDCSQGVCTDSGGTLRCAEPPKSAPPAAAPSCSTTRAGTKSVVTALSWVLAFALALARRRGSRRRPC